MATSEEPILNSLIFKEDPVNETEMIATEAPENTESSENTESDMKTAIKISRQFMILLEDYRYLMSCYQESCDCHVNFDYQVFSRKLEEKYNFLTNLSSNNSFLLNALEDNSDINTLSELMDETEKGDKRKEEHDTEQGPYIKRIKISSKRRSYPSAIGNNDFDDTEDTKNENPRNPIGPIELKAYRCTLGKCEFIAFTQEAMKCHVDEHEGFSASKKDENKNPIIYVCSKCNKEFTAKKWLENHVENVHSNVKMFTCDQYDCNYKTKFRTSFDEHKRRHKGKRNFKCTWEGCTSAFVTKRDMMAHINFFHRHVKNYACTWPNCKATFKDSNRLKHHYFTHSGERPYTCDINGCQASFKQMPHLHKHRKTHTDEAGEKAT